MSVLIDVKYGGYYMMLVTDKAAFVDFDQVGHKTAYESSETSKNLQILDVETRFTVLGSEQ